MIYIGTTELAGQPIYLDIHNVERRGRQLSISAVIGDGCYEGEILIEPFAHSPVTFADDWLGGAGLEEFLQRSGRTWLREQLLEVARRVGGLTHEPERRKRFCGPHPAPRREGQIAEPEAVWTTLF